MSCEVLVQDGMEAYPCALEEGHDGFHEPAHVVEGEKVRKAAQEAENLRVATERQARAEADQVVKTEAERAWSAEATKPLVRRKR